MVPMSFQLSRILSILLSRIVPWVLVVHLGCNLLRTLPTLVQCPTVSAVSLSGVLVPTVIYGTLGEFSCLLEVPIRS